MSALRVARQLATCSRVRFTAAALRTSRTTLLRPSSSRAFSVSPRSLAGATSAGLAEKLDEELKYELENKEEELPAFLTEFYGDGVWELKDTPGNEEVFLTRKFGDETIRVMFSIDDLHNIEEEEELEDEDQAEKPEPAPEFRLSVSISKPTHPAALSFDIYCSDGMLETSNVSFFQTTKIGQELSIESDFARRKLYPGPLFEMLDQGLQDNFTQFLQERGINESLTLFVGEYSKHKEQNEYVQWLDNVGKFIKA
ncbi:regulatory protein suaprga1 [Roridomyces roridus]|uniref:Regulatory protein suaprga1 n=1 Tax=Roridomyces roridus TaxID=1738132 RepID=A0AAD7FRI7_9AGAR|nr:regulatory protein suaprga1 [Roridomyces roridus]